MLPGTPIPRAIMRGLIFFVHSASSTHHRVTAAALAGSTLVFLDSPIAISATEIFRRQPECFEPATAKLFQGGRDPFYLSGLHFTREAAESMSLNNIHGGVVIMAGSGMCTGGRVRRAATDNRSGGRCKALRDSVAPMPECNCCAISPKANAIRKTPSLLCQVS